MTIAEHHHFRATGRAFVESLRALGVMVIPVAIWFFPEEGKDAEAKLAASGVLPELAHPR